MTEKDMQAAVLTVGDYTFAWIAAGQPTIRSAETDPGNRAAK